MQIPIWVLTILALLFGVFPGIAMSLIAKIQSSFNLKVVPYSLHGIATGSGELNMLVVSLVFSEDSAIYRRVIRPQKCL